MPTPAQTTYAAFHHRSLTERDAFWAEQAGRIDWQTPPPASSICDDSRPPFVRWFAGGTTNLCHNAVDRHVATRGGQPALIAISSETGSERVYTYAELLAQVQCLAAVLRALGVGQGDRVLIYLPMVAEAVFAMLACVRIGAIHSVVFGGFASGSLAARIDDAEPAAIVSADAGSRGGKTVAYKPLLDEALRLARHRVPAVLLVDRGLAPMDRVAGRDHDWAALAAAHADAEVPCVWVDATHPSYTLYTSGTTGRPKGVQRDTGGYAVALAASMRHIFDAEPGGTFFCASDVGWVVGHSYIVYGPLLHGMATVLYEGLPVLARPAGEGGSTATTAAGASDAGVWWRIVERHRVTQMFTAPTAIRVLRKHDEAPLRASDTSSLKTLFLAGEPLDAPTAQWIRDALGKPVVDNYWQTESGWPILALANGVARQASKLGSPGVAMAGYDVRLVDEASGADLVLPGEKGVLAIEGPLPPGCLQTIWRDDARFEATYWGSIAGRRVYNTFDYATRDADGYFFILGRTDDVINVAGHRLGTREIEECISGHAQIAEVAVVGVADALKGQVAIAFAVPRRADSVAEPRARLQLEGEVMAWVDRQLGALARPQRVHFVTLLPKTRSGKLLRRALQAVCEGRDAGDLSTLDDPAALQQVRALLAPDVR